MAIKLICIKLIANVRCFGDKSVSEYVFLYFFNRISYPLSLFCLTFAGSISRSERKIQKQVVRKEAIIQKRLWIE